MQITVRSVADLGLALRATRKGSKVRLDDLADIAGVSKQFVSDVERGKQTVQLGLALRLLGEMGLYLTVDIPAGAEGEWSRLQAKAGAAPLRQKAS
jgi:transcriptional regulator with XRE-family HTH domain